jgi:predicted NBD/HSP70 family sugar kinase
MDFIVESKKKQKKSKIISNPISNPIVKSDEIIDVFAKYFPNKTIKNIFIGGGLSASFDFIVPSMEKQLNYWLTPAYLEKLTIKKALLGNDAGLLGAASLCF